MVTKGKRIFKISEKIKSDKRHVLLLLIMLFLVTLMVFFSFSKKQKTYPEKDDVGGYTEQKRSFKEENADYYISIDGLGIRAPIIRDVDPSNSEEYEQALMSGVALMAGTALPGEENGNVFIFGHSSANNNAKYGKIFADLNDLESGDEIKIHFNQEEYRYSVNEKRIIEKDDFSVLEKTGAEQLTLMTCWPPGTDDKRLVVISER